MSDDQLHEWSRHYDTLHWAVVGLSATGVGGLFTASFADGQSIWPELAGLWVLVVGLFFISNFKVFRANIHARFEDKQLAAILSKPGSDLTNHQWEVFGLTFGFAAVLFVWRGIVKSPHLYVVLGAGVLTLLLLLACWRKPFTDREKNERIIPGDLRIAYDPVSDTVNIVGDASGLDFLAGVCAARSVGPTWISAPYALGGPTRLRLAYETRKRIV